MDTLHVHVQRASPARHTTTGLVKSIACSVLRVLRFGVLDPPGGLAFWRFGVLALRRPAFSRFGPPEALVAIDCRLPSRGSTVSGALMSVPTSEHTEPGYHHHLLNGTGHNVSTRRRHSFVFGLCGRATTAGATPSANWQATS